LLPCMLTSLAIIDRETSAPTQPSCRFRQETNSWFRLGSRNSRVNSQLELTPQLDPFQRMTLDILTSRDRSLCPRPPDQVSAECARICCQARPTSLTVCRPLIHPVARQCVDPYRDCATIRMSRKRVHKEQNTNASMKEGVQRVVCDRARALRSRVTSSSVFADMNGLL
jgi:hypothetical protein